MILQQAQSNDAMRRKFLQQITRASLGAPLAVAHPIGPSSPTPGIDTHTHFYDPTRKAGVPWPPPQETLLYQPHYPPAFQALTKSHNIIGTVVVEASPWVEDNQWILALARDNPFIVGFIGNLTLGQPEFAAQLQRFGANPVFRGLRVSGRALGQGLGQAAFEKDLLRLNERAYALDVVGNATLLPEVARAARLAPQLRIVIDHLPFNEWDGNVAALQSALRAVAERPNVYAKISNVIRRDATTNNVIERADAYRPVLAALLQLFGAERVIFGSNWPVSNRVAPYATLYNVVADYFTGPLAAPFFWKNSHTAYRWLPRGATRKLINRG